MEDEDLDGMIAELKLTIEMCHHVNDPNRQEDHARLERLARLARLGVEAEQKQGWKDRLMTCLECAEDTAALRQTLCPFCGDNV